MLVLDDKSDLICVYVPFVEEEWVAGVLMVGVRFDGETVGLGYCSCISLGAAEHGEARGVPAFLPVVRIV